MQDKMEKQTPKCLRYTQYTLAGIVAVTCAVATAFGLIPHYMHRKHAVANLDENAVKYDARNLEHRRVFGYSNYVQYEDTDGDGDYESFVQWKNRDSELVRIGVQKDLEGKLKFSGLSETALPPTKRPLNIPVDYVDVDGDGSLESTTRLRFEKGEVRHKIEFVDGKYIFTVL